MAFSSLLDPVYTVLVELYLFCALPEWDPSTLPIMFMLGLIRQHTGHPGRLPDDRLACDGLYCGLAHTHMPSHPIGSDVTTSSFRPCALLRPKPTCVSTNPPAAGPRQSVLTGPVSAVIAWPETRRLVVPRTCPTGVGFLQSPRKGEAGTPMGVFCTCAMVSYHGIRLRSVSFVLPHRE